MEIRSVEGNKQYSLGAIFLGAFVIVLGLVAAIQFDSATSSAGSQTPNIYINYILDKVGFWPMTIVLIVVGVLITSFHWQAFRTTGALLTISDSGIRYHRFGPEPVPWRAIEAVALDPPILGLPGTTKVRLRMDDSNAIFDQLPSHQGLLRRLIGPFDKASFIIHVGELNIRAEELETIIRRRLRL